MRMRRRSRKDEPGEESAGATPEEGAAGAAEGAAAGQQADPRANGPWDDTERQVDEDDTGYVSVGSLAVRGRPGVEVRLQADQATNQIQSVMLVAEDGAMELRPFAAPRNESIWGEIRQRLAAEAQRRGGRAGEVDGPYGKALQMILPAVAPDGQQGTQTSTVLGIEGPRWLLRVSTFGRPATTFQTEGLLEQVLQDVVVSRGSEPMSPGEPLPLTLPAGARRVAAPEQDS